MDNHRLLSKLISTIFYFCSNDFSTAVAREYVALFNFAGLRLDSALRKFLAHIMLTGESQQRERIVAQFSARYNECNPALFTGGEDDVHTLACALLLLNNDLHGPVS